MRFDNKRITKITSYILLFCMLLNGIVFNIPRAHAQEEGDKGKDSTKKVKITNVYDASFYKKEKYIEIKDDDIAEYEDKKLDISTTKKWEKDIKNVDFIGKTIVQAELNPEWVIEEALISGRVKQETDPPTYKGKEVKYEGIDEKGIPEIINVNKPVVETDEVIILNGKGNIEDLVNEKYIITVGGVKAKAGKVINKNQIKLEPAGSEQFPRGNVDIVVRYVRDKNGEQDYDMETVSIYEGAVRIVGDLGIEGVQMFPTMGEPGSDVRFTRKNFPTTEGYDIYFIKNLNSPEFTEENMAKNFRRGTEGIGENEKETITVSVPNVSSGPYHIVFTNKDSQDKARGIESSYVLPQKFQVVTISQSPTIDSVIPNSASAMTPTKVEIKGNFFTKHNIPGLETSKELTINDIKTGDRQITINYGEGTLTLPDETGKNKTYEAEKVERIIEIDIGAVLPFEEDGFEYDLKNDGDPNTFIVKTEKFTLEETQIEDIVVRMTTKITGEFNATMKKEVVVPKGFTYYSPTEKPNVKEVIPNIIPIEEAKGENGGFYLESSMEKLLISIEGDKFLVTRYKDQEGNEKISYPKVTLGGVVINPNADENKVTEHKPLKYEVLKDGKKVDGTMGNEIGNRILIELKAGEDGFKVANKDSRNIYIQNPIRQSKEFANTAWPFEEMVKFELINKNDFPVINKVEPSLVSMDGGEDVKVTGSNFRPGAKVYIENRLVPGANISGDGKTITFKAPKGSRPGETLLQVINPEGGVATHVFTYTKTYTEPKLGYINPKEGTTNTLVMAKGANFLPPDPTIVVDGIENIDESLIYRLIGTRIFMDGHDINEYNRGEQNKIKLQQFTGEEDIFKYDADTKEVLLGEGYESTVLYDETNKKFYAIRRDVRNDYYIEGGEGIRYKVHYGENGEDGWAVTNGSTQKITFEDNKKGEIKIGENLHLKAYTPFKINEEGKIVGNRVNFIDSNTLTFEVPLLSKSPWTGEGYYDVSIVNPDTKKQTIKKGFYYFASSNVRPKIVDVVPDRGPDKGGNIIKLIGPSMKEEKSDKVGFMDTGTDKTKVFIGGQEVPKDDVIISPNGRQMEVKVPPTIEDIKLKGTDRITVPIVVVNPDGGTFSISYDNPIYVEDTIENEEEEGNEKDKKEEDKEDQDQNKEAEKTTKKVIRGYTYVVPTSNPKISEISPKEGSAAGGYILEIFGSDFRDFEPFTDTKGIGEYEEGMPFDDIDGDGEYTAKAPRDREKSKYNSRYKYLTSPIFPRVYFGNKEAEVVEFGSGYLQVVVPPNEAGTVDLYVVNNDSGISNKVRFTYKATNPAINSINPNVGMKAGGDILEIHGRDFETNRINLLKENGKKELKEMPLVRFGERTNENLPREDANSGVIRSGRTTVGLEGGINIHLNSQEGILKVKLEQNKKTYEAVYEDYNGEEIFINTKDLKTKDEAYPYEELIRLKVKDNRLLVEGGFAPEAEYRNKTQVSATTPYYYTVGSVPVFIINPDGGTGEGRFEYKHPDSKPAITNITKEGRDPVEEHREEIDGKARILKVDYKGGNIISVHGTDFREGATINISNILTINEKQIDYELPTKLTFELPAVPESEIGKLHRLVVINKDGGTATSDKAVSNKKTSPIYIEFTKGESNPEVLTIDPNSGPASGGTKVKITGNDFREKMEGYEGEKPKVYFGESQAKDVKVKDYKTIEAIAPKSEKLGQVPVRVENPDGSLSSGSVNFTYISKPEIESTDPSELFTNDTNTEVTITGKMFMSGAKVVVGGAIVDKKDVKKDMDIKGEGITGVINGRNREVAVVGGMEAASVKVESDKVIKVKFNEAKDLKNNHLIIINPDGGISDPYKKFDYKKPLPDKPLILEAVPGYESTVKLIWSESDEDLLNRATRYEVYGKLTKDKHYTFVGDTKDAEFLVKGLKRNTEYKFGVRALNEYGAALSFAEAKVKTLNTKEDYKGNEKEDNIKDEDKKLKKEGKEEIIENRVVKTLGTADIVNGKCSVDFSLRKYKDYDAFTVAIPMEIVKENPKLTIKDGDMSFEFNPKNLYVYGVRIRDKKDKDSHIRVHFERERETNIPRNKKVASKAYNIYFDYQYGRNTYDIDNMLRNGRLTIIYDSYGYPSRKNIYLAGFNEPSGEYIYLTNGTSANIRKSGRYILLSNR